jgi:hypothetical protein
MAQVPTTVDPSGINYDWQKINIPGKGAPDVIGSALARCGMNSAGAFSDTRLAACGCPRTPQSPVGGLAWTVGPPGTAAFHYPLIRIEPVLNAQRHTERRPTECQSNSSGRQPVLAGLFVTPSCQGTDHTWSPVRHCRAPPGTIVACATIGNNMRMIRSKVASPGRSASFSNRLASAKHGCRPGAARFAGPFPTT